MDGNDAAFPHEVLGEHAFGLTKRELFAAMAMQGLTANPKADGSFAACAKDAVKFADALIAELSK